MKEYYIVNPVMLSFLDQDQYDKVISSEDGYLKYDGKNIIFVDLNGDEHKSITTNNAIDIWLENGGIIERINTNSSLYIKDQDIITCWNKDSTEIIRIAHDGRIFWRQREVETDDEFRQAMMDLANWIKGNAR